MKELKRSVTTEETYGYEAFDGSFFKTADDCRKYEQSALSVAKRAAETFLKNKPRSIDAIERFSCSEDYVHVYSIPDVSAMQCVNTYLRLYCGQEDGKRIITPRMVGHDVAVLFYGWDTDCDVIGTKADLLKMYTDAIEDVFSAPANPANPSA